MKKRLLMQSACAIAAILCLSASAEKAQPVSIQSHNYDVQIHALGPGHQNLSPGDSYAIYQWAFQNEGEYQLVGLQNRFQKIDPLLASIIEVAEKEGIRSPSIGPGNYETVRIQSVAGIDIKMRQAWEVYDNSTGPKRQVTVAIIDTGIDITHPELKDALWINEDEIPGDGIDNDGNGYIDDYNGWNFYDNTSQIYHGAEDDHGTHAAGTISAARNNEGIAGINDSNYVKIMPLKVLGTAEGLGTVDAVTAAIRYAEANGASICNLSFGTLTSYPELQTLMQNSKMLFVVSAGNGDLRGVGYNIDNSPVYPASYQLDNVITVANLMFDGNLDTSSNYGVQCVDLAAPGTYILSCTSEGSYGYMSGTSMSAPMVTGVAAMLYSYRTDISLLDVKQILINSAQPMESLTGKTAAGGMLDAYGALTYSFE